ncbi:hypothetical protein U9M48_031178 [Paspalum notatum var. saurae]|uniref:Uncharacterized protein n=1 Tax=Paspalum notatum var. saurae TaxID=547442 RepID=A0AAQ3X3G8_PASNO
MAGAGASSGQDTPAAIARHCLEHTQRRRNVLHLPEENPSPRHTLAQFSRLMHGPTHEEEQQDNGREELT